MKRWGIIILFFFSATAIALGQASTPGNFNVQLSLGNENGLNDFGVSIQILLLMTVLTLAPTIVLMMTSFLRIVIVLGFVRQALGTMQSPPNQVIVGLALFITLFVMTPVLENVYEESYVPYENGSISSTEAFDRAMGEFKGFMLAQTRPEDLNFFLEVSGNGPTAISNVPMTVALPSFLLSELRTAFQMGIMIFIPFLVIDFVVASSLMSLGMMMMPPVMIAMPFKLLIFVLVDGWGLILQSLVRSFGS